MAFALVSHINRLSISAAGTSRIMAQYGISPTRMGTVYSAFLVTYTLCMIPGGLVLDRFGARAALMTWFACSLGAVGMAEGPFWATAVALGGRRGGSAAALLNTGGNAGGFLAPTLTPWIGKHLGWPLAVSLGGLICLSGVLLWLWIDPVEKLA